MGMCPQGFDAPDLFPPEWEIPQWPANMTPEQAGRLKTVKLGGFKMEEFNEEFLEGPGLAFFVQGKRTFWQASGQYFLYWCQRFQKWRIAGISGFSKNKNGNCLAFVSDGLPSRDILNASLIKGWLEVEGGEWKVRQDAGVVAIGTLADQFREAEDNATEEVADCDADNETEGEGIFKTKQKKSNCPVMPVVRKVKEKVKEKVVEATEAASKWVRRLFPQLMGPAAAEPSQEESQPEAAPAPPAGDSEL